MNRGFRVTFIAICMGILMTQFQNCAKVSPSVTSSGGSTVHLVGDIKSGVAFPQTSVQIYDAATEVYLGGICDQAHNGDSLTWYIRNGSTELAGSGSFCQGGQFEVDLPNASQMVCGMPYELNVMPSWGDQPATMTVTKLCPALATSALINPPPNDGQPRTCRLEYRMSGSASNQGLCQAVCYEQNVVSYLQAQPETDCQSLADQLQASSSGQ